MWLIPILSFLIFYCRNLYNHAYYRHVFRDRLRFWLKWLKALCYGRLMLAFVMLYTDEQATYPEFVHLKILGSWLLILAFVDFASWSLVFRDPHRFLGFRRPNRGYHSAIYITSAATTVPSLVLHIQIMLRSYKVYPFYEIIFFGHTVAILQFLVTCGFYLWMLHRFLLRAEEEHYEPVIPLLGSGTTSTPSLEPLSQSAVAALEPYLDSSELSFSHESYLRSNGHLSKAYIMQRDSNRLSIHEMNEEDYGERSAVQGSALRHDHTDSSSLDLSDSTSVASIDLQRAYHLKCPTAARFDYMFQGRIGAHSWFSYPLIPAILGTLSTISIGLIVPVIVENSNLAKSSP